MVVMLDDSSSWLEAKEAETSLLSTSVIPGRVQLQARAGSEGMN